MIDVNTTLANTFGSLIDDNEGLTIFRSLNIPVGGRVESLGTAFTGVADDISYFDYNPAASSVLENTELSVFHNAWISDSAMETLAYTQRNGNLGYGAQIKCFYVPFTEYNLFGEHVTGSYYTETSAAFNISYNFLSGYDFKGIAVGLNTRFSWRNIPDYSDNQTDKVMSGSGLEQSSLGIMGDLGILVRLNAAKFYGSKDPNLKIGFSATNLGCALTGFGKSVELDDALPTKLSLGVSYKPFKPFMISMEFRQPINLQEFSSSGKWSAALGLEGIITRFFSIQSGFLIQGGNPRISLGSEFTVKSVQMNLCYTFDLTSSANPVNHISLCAKIRLGDGGRKLLLEAMEQSYIAGVELYSQGRLEEAIDKWNESLSYAENKKLKLNFTPAKECIETARKFLEINDSLQDLQKITSDLK